MSHLDLFDGFDHNEGSYCWCRLVSLLHLNIAIELEFGHHRLVINFVLQVNFFIF